MTAKVKNIRCKVCNMSFANPSAESLDYLYNACKKPAKACGLSKVPELPSNKEHTVILYKDQTPAWLQTGNVVHVLYDDPISGTLKGEPVV